MKSVVLGKVIENVYSVDTKQKTITDEHDEEKKVYTAKPVLINNPNIKEWKEICSFEGEPRYNFHYWHRDKDFNISENESVNVNREIFRADLNELHLQTNKVLEEIDVNKEGANYEYEAHIEQFNKMMIMSNKMMQDYCDLHKLDYRFADCEKVFSLVYPEKEYEIKDGKMICKPTYTILGSGLAVGSDNIAKISIDSSCTMDWMSQTVDCIAAKIDGIV